MTSAPTTLTDPLELERGKRRRQQREALLAILFVAPATIVTFVFRIWPVIFGFYVSLHQWRANSHSFLGLDQYVRALGNAAYVLAFLLCILFFYGGYIGLRKARQEMAEGKGNFYPYLLPGLILSVGIITLMVGMAAQDSDLFWAGAFLALIGGAVYWAMVRRAGGLVLHHFGLHAVQLCSLWLLGLGLFVFAIVEIQANVALAFQMLVVLAPDLFVPPLILQMIMSAVLVLAALGAYAVSRWRSRLTEEFDRRRIVANLLVALLLLLAIGSFFYLIAAFQFDTEAAAAVQPLGSAEVGGAGEAATGLPRDEFRRLYGAPKGENLASMLMAWPQVLSISIGFFLMFVAYRLWKQAAAAERDMSVATFLGLAIVLAIGGWLLIVELPQAMASGDLSYYQSLLITVSYALGTVPLQLGLGLFLAYILFYEVRFGKSFYRVVYFIPYVAPTVVTATVFGIIFSPRPYSLANQVLTALGIQPVGWLQESKGVFLVIAQMLWGPDVIVPSFLAGPSLALISIIIYSIWVFAGYNAVIFLAGLGAIPGELFEAAKVDGAGRWQAFRRIIFPLLSPTTFFLLILSITGTFRAFTHVYTMRQAAARGSADTATVHIFLQFWQFNQWGYASAMAFVLFGIILILTLIQNELSKERVFYG